MIPFQLIVQNRRVLGFRFRPRRILPINLRRCTYHLPTTRALIEQLGIQRYLHIRDSRCPSCNSPMQLEERKKRRDGYQLRCGSCDKNMSIRHNSFFARHPKIPLPTLFHIIRSFYEGRQQRFIAEETRLNPSTIQRIHADYASACKNHNDSHPIVFDANDIVEIDEKRLRWRRGLYDPDPNAMVVEGDWVLGMVGRRSKKVYMVPVIGRAFEDLIPIIRRRVVAGATIISDKLATYNVFNMMNYTYRCINKKRDGFARDDIGLGLRIHVNTIEGQWQKIEIDLIQHHSLYGHRVDALLHEYMFRKNGGDFLDLLKY